MNKTEAKFHFRTIEVQEIRDALPRLKQQKALELTIFLATSSSLLYPSLKIPLLSCLIHQLKQVFFQTHGKLVGLLLFTKMEIGLFFYINIKYYNICYLLLYFNYYATLQGRCQEEQKTMSTPWPTHENTQLNQQLNKHLQTGTHTIRY